LEKFPLYELTWRTFLLPLRSNGIVALFPAFTAISFKSRAKAGGRNWRAPGGFPPSALILTSAGL